MPKGFAGFSKPEEHEVSGNRRNGVTVGDFFGGHGGGRVAELPLDELIPFQGRHPFKPYSEEKLMSLVESIKERGVLNPVLVRRVAILAGHNRVEASRRAGLDSVLCRVLDVDDDEAMLIVIESNLEQREILLPSEKAFSYKYRVDILKRQGKRTDLANNGLDLLSDENAGQIVHKLGARDVVAEENDDNYRSVARFIRLTFLNSALLNMVDEERIPFMSGVNLSFLSPVEQSCVAVVLAGNPAVKVTVALSQTLKDMSANGTLDDDVILSVLDGSYGRKVIKLVPYGVRASQDYTKYIKRVTKKRPLSEHESSELLERIKQVTDDFLSELDE